MNSKLTFDEFDKVSREDWLKLADKELKGAEAKDVLNWNIEGAISANAYPDAGINFTPYGRRSNSWSIIELISSPDFSLANRQALEALNSGATGLHVQINFTSADELAILFKDILLQHITVFVEVDALAQANVFQSWLSTQNIQPEQLNGGIIYAGITRSAREGKFIPELKAEITAISKLFANYGTFRCMGANESLYHEAGANTVESTAFMLSEAIEYIQIQLENGIDIDTASANVFFMPAVSSKYLPEIARLRSMRQLWAKAIEAYTPKHGCSKFAYLYTSSSAREIALPDAHSNMLRATSQAMSAVVGGSEALYIKPYDTHTDKSAFGRRIARNVQLLLEHESFMNEVTDPAAGSRYIESLTAEFSRKVWDLFCVIQDLGGHLVALERNYIQWKIKHSLENLQHNIAEGKTKIIGVNVFPNPKDKELPTPPSQTAHTEDFEAIVPAHPYAQYVKPVNA